MTPARKAALQWFHDRGEVSGLWQTSDRPSMRIIGLMLKSGELDERTIAPWRYVYSLTDKGRRMLHGDPK